MIFSSIHINGLRNGLIPRFKLLSHVLAEWLTFERALILEIKPFLKSKPFSPILAYFKKNGLDHFPATGQLGYSPGLLFYNPASFFSGCFPQAIFHTNDWG